MKLQLFNGGLNIRQDNLLIAPNEAVTCENVDTTTGSLKSSLDKTASNPAIDSTYTPFYFESNDSWEDRSDVVDYLEYQNKLYWTTTIGAKKYDGTTEQNLGLPRPVNAVITTDDSVPAASTITTNNIDTSMALTAPTNGAGSFVAGPYDVYAVSYKTDRDGVLKPLESIYLQVIIGALPNNGVDLTITGPVAGEDLYVKIYVTSAGFTNVTPGGVYVQAQKIDVASPIVSGTPIVLPTLTADQSDTTVNFGGTTMVDDSRRSLVGDTTGSRTSTNLGASVSSNIIEMDFSVGSGEGILYKKFADKYYRIYRSTIGYTRNYVTNADINTNTITGITKANPCVVTVSSHGHLEKDHITITGVEGMTELNGNNYTVQNVTSTTFELYTEVYTSSTLTAVDSSAFTTYSTSGYTKLKEYVSEGNTGTYQYVFTYYNEDDGTESRPSDISTALVVTGGSVGITGISNSFDTQVTHKKIYRIGGTTLNFTEIAEVTATTTTYTDSITDADIITASILDSALNGVPPVGLKYLRQVFGVFVGAVGSRMYFTRDIGNPNYWPEIYYLNFPTTITGIGIANNNIVVFTKYKSYAVSGSNANTFVRYNLSGDQGCINHDTIVEYGGQILFVSTDGICTLTNNIVKVISKEKLGKITLSTTNAVIHDEAYYVQLTDGSILCMDFRYKNNIKYFDFTTDYLYVANDILYGRVSGGTLLYTLFTGSEVSYTYSTGDLSEGIVTNLKSYNDFYAYCDSGSHTVKIYIDDTLVATHSITSGLSQLTIPQNNMLGYKLRFDLTGTGTLNEIEYKPEGRKNGR